MSCPGCPRPDSHCTVCDTHGALNEKGECFNEAEHPSTKPTRKSRAKKQVVTAEPTAEVTSITVVGDLTPTEARALTERVKASVEQVNKDLAMLHDRRGWKALGYVTWAAYVEAELDVSVRRARQLRHHGRLLLELEGGDGRPEPGVPVPTEKETRTIADADAWREHVEARKAANEAETAVQALATELALALSPQPVDEPGDIEDAVVVDEDAAAEAVYGPEPEPEHDTPDLPQAKLHTPSKAAIRAMRSLIPVLTNVSAATNSVPEFDALPSLEARRNWLNVIQQARRVLLVLERDIKSTMDSPGDDE